LKTADKPSLRNVGGHSIDDIKRLDEIEIEFSHNRKHDYDEFMRQLNGLTIQEYFNNKELFDELGRDTSINVIIKEIRGKALEYETEKLVATQMDFAAAAKQAKDWLKTQAVLHNPDQVAGGLGDKNINSSIGS